MTKGIAALGNLLARTVWSLGTAWFTPGYLAPAHGRMTERGGLLLEAIVPGPCKALSQHADAGGVLCRVQHDLRHPRAGAADEDGQALRRHAAAIAKADEVIRCL